MLLYQYHKALYSSVVCDLLAVVLLLVALSGACQASQKENEYLDIVPDKAIQDQIDRTADAFLKADRRSGLDHAFSELHKLEGLVGKNRVKLIQQLLLYESKTTDNKGMMPLVILKYLEYSDFIRVEALAPYIDPENPKLLRLDLLHFGTIDRIKGKLGGSWDPLNPPNYRTYQTYIKMLNRREKPIPLPFVAYIYRRAPGMALRAFLGEPKRYGKTPRWPKENMVPVVWAEHVVSTAIWRKNYGFQDKFEEVKQEAIKELDKLSRHDAWWVRLYVAEIMRQHKGFRQPEIIERLKQDKHPLVRETIAAFAEKAEPPGGNKK